MFTAKEAPFVLGLSPNAEKGLVKLNFSIDIHFWIKGKFRISLYGVFGKSGKIRIRKIFFFVVRREKKVQQIVFSTVLLSKGGFTRPGKSQTYLKASTFAPKTISFIYGKICR